MAFHSLHVAVRVWLITGGARPALQYMPGRPPRSTCFLAGPAVRRARSKRHARPSAHGQIPMGSHRELKSSSVTEAGDWAFLKMTGPFRCLMYYVSLLNFSQSTHLALVSVGTPKVDNFPSVSLRFPFRATPTGSTKRHTHFGTWRTNQLHRKPFLEGALYEDAPEIHRNVHRTSESPRRCHSARWPASRPG